MENIISMDKFEIQKKIALINLHLKELLPTGIRVFLDDEDPDNLIIRSFDFSSTIPAGLGEGFARHLRGIAESLDEDGRGGSIVSKVDPLEFVYEIIGDDLVSGLIAVPMSDLNLDGIENISNNFAAFYLRILLKLEQIKVELLSGKVADGDYNGDF